MSSESDFAKMLRAKKEEREKRVHDNGEQNPCKFLTEIDNFLAFILLIFCIRLFSIKMRLRNSSSDLSSSDR